MKATVTGPLLKTETAAEPVIVTKVGVVADMTAYLRKARSLKKCTEIKEIKGATLSAAAQYKEVPLCLI